MKTKLVPVILLLLTSCAPATPTSAPTDPPAQMTEPPAIAEPATQESVVTKAPVATEPPTQAPTKPSLACVTLLTPENSADLPPTGKVTFSWTPMDGADSYNLNIILPSGETVTFETDQTFRDRYMEAFTAGSEYGWQVIAQGEDGNEICISESFTFDKPEHQRPTGGGGDGGGSDSGGSSGGGNDSGVAPPPPPPIDD
jgi:hypothetical protein